MSGEITRREVLKRGLIAAAGLSVAPAVIAACNSVTPSPTPTPVPSKPAPTPGPAVTLSHNYVALADSAYRDAIAAIDTAFEAATGMAVAARPRESVFGDEIQPYLQGGPNGGPDDLTFWYPGFRMRFFVQKGLIAPIDDVWSRVSANYTAAFATAVTGDDGHVYGVPIACQPWLFFYRRSVWAAKGYKVPTTWTELLALCSRMKKDKLNPIAFGDKDGWPALFTFDMLNLRLNGYDFHTGLMAGNEKWTDARVTSVFRTWARLAPFYTPGSAGLIWQEARNSLLRKTAGMYYSGSFLTDTVDVPDRPALTDLDCFPFPYFGNAFDAERAVEAPVDVLVACSKSPTLGADLSSAGAYLEFWASGSTQMLWRKANPEIIPPASDVDTTQLDSLGQKAASTLGGAQRIAQGMDRDIRPEMAGPSGMQNFLLIFLKNPTVDTTDLQARIQAFQDALPTYS